MNRNFALFALVFCAIASPGLHAKEVRMAFGLTLPPYVIAETNSGFQLEIIAEALALKGHTLKPVYVPLPRVGVMLQEKQVNAAERGNPEITEEKGFFYGTDQAVVYQDFAISLKKNNLTISKLDDLKGKSIIGFSGATTFLGDAYAAAVKGNTQYTESNDQKRQPLMLYANRTQVIVCDHNIFKYFAQSVKGEVDMTQEVVYHKIFPSSTLKFNNQVFTDKQLRDDFDAGLKALKASGRDKEIMRKYVK